MTKIEQVAKALYEKNESRSNVLGPPWEKLMELPIRLYYEEVARTAIEAMREPTEAMKQVGLLDPGSGGPDPGYETEVWQAMIDAALSD